MFVWERVFGAGPAIAANAQKCSRAADSDLRIVGYKRVEAPEQALLPNHD
jgi:hypothetical protein